VPRNGWDFRDNDSFVNVHASQFKKLAEYSNHCRKNKNPFVSPNQPNPLKFLSNGREPLFILQPSFRHS
jgi:hypothetical protein